MGKIEKLSLYRTAYNSGLFYNNKGSLYAKSKNKLTASISKNVAAVNINETIKKPIFAGAEGFNFNI